MRAVLAFVGEMRHVGLEDNRAAARQHRWVGDRRAELARLLDRQRKPPDKLAQEIARALRAAAVLAKHVDAVVAQFQHGETVAAEGNHRGRRLAEPKPVARSLRLLGRHLR
jgi:hypothetical protein